MKKLTLFLIFFVLILNIYSQYGGGNGTESNPYLINNSTHFKNIKNNLNAYYRLTQDIDFAGDSLDPIGTFTNPFTGNLEGANYKIENFTFRPYVTSTTALYGLFGYISAASIKNLNIENVWYHGHYFGPSYNLSPPPPTNYEIIYSGILAAVTEASAIENIKIINSVLILHNEWHKRFVGDVASFKSYAGGLIGDARNSTIVRCSYSNGGKVGHAYWMTLLNSLPPLSGYPSSEIYQGGLIGKSLNSNIAQCFFNGNFIIYGNLADLGADYIGGLVGYATEGSISDSYAIHAGGDNFYGRGWDMRLGDIHYSGFISLGSTPVSYSYAIVDPTYIPSFYFTGSELVSGTQTELGYFNGSQYTGTVISCISTDHYQIGYEDIIVGKFNIDVKYGTLDSLKEKTFYTDEGFNFSSIWAIDSTQNNGYPYIGTAIPPPPPPPLDLTPGIPDIWSPTNNTINAELDITLKWNAPETGGAVEQYVFQVKLFSDSTIVASGYDNSSTTQHYLTGVLNYSTKYIWRVGAINDYGTTYSNYFTFTTKDEPVVILDTPVLTSPANNAVGITLPETLQWNDVINATEYQIQIKDVNNLFVIELDTTSVISEVTIPINRLDFGIKYVWSVRAINIADTSEWARRYFTTQVTLPDTVVFLNPVKNSTNIIVDSSKIIWKYVNNVSYNSIQVLDTLTSQTILNLNVYLPDTSYKIRTSSGFERDRWYKLRGKAYNSAGESNWTDWILFKTRSAGDEFDTTYLSVSIDTAYKLGESRAVITNEGIWDTTTNKIWFGGRENIGTPGDAFLGYINYVDSTSSVVLNETSLNSIGMAIDWWGSSHYYNSFTGFGMSGRFVKDDSLLINTGFGIWRSGIDVKLYPRVQILNLNTLQKVGGYYSTVHSYYKARGGSFLSLYTNHIPERNKIIDFGGSDGGQVMVVNSYSEDSVYAYNVQLNNFGEWDKGAVRGSYYLNDSLYIFTTRGDSIHFYSKHFPKDESYVNLKEGWEITEGTPGDIEIIDENHVKDIGIGEIYFDNNYNDVDQLWAEIADSGNFTIIAFAKPDHIENGFRFDVFGTSGTYVGLLQTFDGRFRIREPSVGVYYYPNAGTVFSTSTYEMYGAVVSTDSVTFYYKGKKEGSRIPHVGDITGYKKEIITAWNRLTGSSGQLKEFRYYSTALSDTEVDSISQRIYNIHNNRKIYPDYYSGIIPAHHWTLTDKESLVTIGDTVDTWKDGINNLLFTQRNGGPVSAFSPKFKGNSISLSFSKTDMIPGETYKIKVVADTSLNMVFSDGTSIGDIQTPITINDSTYVTLDDYSTEEDKITVTNISSTSSYIGSIDVRDTLNNMPSIPYYRHGYKHIASIPNYNFVTSLEMDKSNKTTYFLLTNSNTATSPWTRRGAGGIYKYNHNLKTLEEIPKPAFLNDSMRVSSIYFKDSPNGKDYSVLWATFTDTTDNENFMIGYIISTKKWLNTHNSIRRIEKTFDIYGQVSNIDTFHITPQRMYEVNPNDYYIYLNIDKSKWVDIVGDPVQTENAYYVFKLSNAPTVINYITANINIANNSIFQTGRIYPIGFTSSTKTNVIEIFDSTDTRILINTLVGSNNGIYNLSMPKTPGLYRLKITPDTLENATNIIVPSNVYFYTADRNIKILTANINTITDTVINISASVFTSFVTSFNVLYKFGNSNFEFINTWEPLNNIDTANINLNIILQSKDLGRLYLKAEAGESTSGGVIIPHKYHKTGFAATPDKRICYHYSLKNAIRTDWKLDLACGWSALAPYSGGTKIKKDNFVYPKYDPNYADTLSLVGYENHEWFSFGGGCLPLANNSSICWGIKRFEILGYSTEAEVISQLTDPEAKYYLPGVDPGTIEIEGKGRITSISSYFSIHNQSYIYKGYRYWIDKENAKVYVNDLVNGIDNILLCDYSDLYTTSSQWVPAYFHKESRFIYSFSIFPFSKIQENSTFRAGSPSGSPYSYVITQAAFDSLLTDQTILNTFVPELRIVGGPFNNSISIPLLGEAPELYIYDIYPLDLVQLRDYFRGIKPRANRHQKYPYNLKGR